MKSTLLTIVTLLSLNACKTVEQDVFADYLVLSPADSNIKSNTKINAFINVYNQLEDNALADNVAKAYAEKLYFNDTVVTLHDRQAVQKYLQHTQDSLDSMQFKVLEIYEKNNDILVRWSMRTQFTILGQQRDVHSIGISHLRFDGDGKIIMHQDYWDSTQGFYQNIPIIGGLLQWIKSVLQDY
ncbi:nuclear transport factor 2 family protein [Methyloglobulus sp.]|uniref:nuclear transport factor 2 family protein n=1 Tax=Methyloglobulus sp. TaxID=2518622 RepID=UPI0032B7F38D